MKVEQSKILGEAGTGYEDGKKGEFECENCRYFRPGESSCGNAVMVARSKQPLLASGGRKVDAEGCCEYGDRLGKIEPEERAERSRFYGE